MTEKSRNSAPGNTQLRATGDSRRSWLIRGANQDYRILRGSDLTEEERKESVPATHLVANLDRWLSSLFTRRMLGEMHELRTGTQLSGLFQDRQAPDLLRKSLAEAFKSKHLVALPASDIRIAKRGQTATQAPVLVDVPLLAEEPGPKPDVGEKKALAATQPKEQTVTVKPWLQVEYKVVLLDRKLSAHQALPEPKIAPEPVYLELWLTQDADSPQFDKGARIQVSGSGMIELYEDAELTKKVDLSQPLPNAQLMGGKTLKLWAVGIRAGKLEVQLEPEDAAGFIKDAAAKVELGVVELKFKLSAWNSAQPPVQQELSDEAKVKSGRLLHAQSSSKDHARARLDLEKLSAAQWPDGTDDYEIVLTQQGTGKLELFGTEWDGAPLPFPYKLKKSALASNSKELWVQGKTASTQALDIRLDLGMDRPAVKPTKSAKTGGDWARFTVLEIEKVAPSDQFTTPGADYTNNHYEVLINTRANGHKKKLKARVKPALPDVPLYFMLAADKDNGKVANTGEAIPAAMQTTAGNPWSWKDIDASLQKKDKAAPANHWHLSAKTDLKGEAEVEVQLSQIGGDVFYPGVYFGQDPHLAKYEQGDAILGKRQPLLGKKLTVWRKLWYQLCMAQSCAAPRPSHTETAYQRVKAHLIAGTTKKFVKADLPAALQDCTFYPQWMIKPGGADQEVAVVGGHNWLHFRTNEATFFPPTHADEVNTLRTRVMVVDHQWDPDGWTGTKRITMTTKTSGDVDMAGIVVKPTLVGNLIHTATWKVVKLADRSIPAQGNLTDANILISKPRTSLSKIKIELPVAADPYLGNAAYEIQVELKLAQAREYLGESDGRHILAVYDSSAVSDYHDTITHEIGHSVKQTPRPPAQPKGMPDHEWWNYGQGVHCANPTIPSVRDPASFADPVRAQQNALCIMFESGPVPTARNKFCGFCHHYLLAQDMTTIA